MTLPPLHCEFICFAAVALILWENFQFPPLHLINLYFLPLSLLFFGCFPLLKRRYYVIKNALRLFFRCVKPFQPTRYFTLFIQFRLFIYFALFWLSLRAHKFSRSEAFEKCLLLV